MNTSFHWRSNATNLLSAEFLALCKGHLNPGGVVYYNTTGSEDVTFTAATVFAHVTTYGSFVAASDSPFSLSAEERRANLLRFTLAGRSLLKADPEGEAALDLMSKADLGDRSGALLARRDLGVITDDNMRTEFKQSLGNRYRWYSKDASWSTLRSASETAAGPRGQ
jgi:hypothetical protein